jgi:curved DNA-binding protein CbpA
MSSPVPQATGTLESTPFGELLVQALDQRLTGTLILEETAGVRHGIYLEAGLARRARLAAPGEHLGEILVDAGAISAETHERTLERALRERVLHGQLLLGEGLIDSQRLAFGLREQLSRQLVWLFARPLDTHYGYFSGTNFLAQWGAPAPAPSLLEVLWRGVRDHAHPREIENALRRLEGLKLELRSGLPPNYFAFLGEDRGIVAFFERGPRRLSELLRAEPALEGAIRRVLYFLVLTRSVDLGFPSAPPVGLGDEPFVGPRAARVPSFTNEASPTARSGARPISVPPRRDSPPSIPPAVVHSATLREELRRRLEHESRTHYDVLGIPEDALPRQVQSAFFLLSKRWHPDRLGSESTDVRESAARVYETILRAHAVLADPAARSSYDAALRSGASADSTPVVERAFSAEVAFQKAESLLARGNLEAAEREAKLALVYDPKRPEHVALVAWLAALKPDADYRRIAAELARVARGAENNLKVHWYRGLFLKRVGRHASALQEFRFVTEKDPRHIDAAREVRLYEQRMKNSPKDRLTLAPDEAASRPSTWSRLFKRRS